MASFPKVGWIVIGLGVVVGAVLGFAKKASAAAPVGPSPKSPTEEKPPVVVTPTELTDAKSAKYYEDENGVKWDFYGWSDGTWEATITDPSIATAYVRNFHEVDPETVLFMIKSHAETYDRNGVLKPGLVPEETKPAGETPPSGLPDYKPGAKCANGSACWVMVDPQTTINLPPNATTSPLAFGETVVYYIGDNPDAVKTTYLALVTAEVVGAKIDDATSIYGSYPIRIVNATLLRGTAPTKLPPPGFEMDQWRQGLISGNPFAG